MLTQAEVDEVLGLAITGWPEAAEKKLRRRIGAIARHAAFHAKIGITNNPRARWNQAYKHRGWERMYVFYKSSSIQNVRDMEDRLIDYLWNACKAAGKNWNVNRGGGGPEGRLGPHYVYMVTAKRYARIS